MSTATSRCAINAKGHDCKIFFSNCPIPILKSSNLFPNTCCNSSFLCFTASSIVFCISCSEGSTLRLMLFSNSPSSVSTTISEFRG